MDMSAQQLTQMLANLLSRRAGTTSSNVSGAMIAVTPGPDTDERGAFIIALPGGKTFSVLVTELS